MTTGKVLGHGTEAVEPAKRKTIYQHYEPESKQARLGAPDFFATDHCLFN